MKKLVLILVCCLFAPMNVTAQREKIVKQKQLGGTWKSAAAEDAGGIYITREFTFNGNKWRVDSRFYNDVEMKQPYFSYVAEGKYKLQNASQTVAGATNAVFYFSKKSLTLLSEDSAVAERFRFAQCNLTPNISADISASGCSFFTSIATCGQEFDLVKIEDNKLYLGKRPADRNMCTEEKRPFTLALPVTRLK